MLSMWATSKWSAYCWNMAQNQMTTVACMVYVQYPELCLCLYVAEVSMRHDLHAARSVLCLHLLKAIFERFGAGIAAWFLSIFFRSKGLSLYGNFHFAVYAQKDTPMIAAVTNGNLDMVKLLWSYKQHRENVSLLGLALPCHVCCMSTMGLLTTPSPEQ